MLACFLSFHLIWRRRSGNRWLLPNEKKIKMGNSNPFLLPPSLRRRLPHSFLSWCVLYLFNVKFSSYCIQCFYFLFSPSFSLLYLFLIIVSNLFLSHPLFFISKLITISSFIIFHYLYLLRFVVHPLTYLLYISNHRDSLMLFLSPILLLIPPCIPLSPFSSSRYMNNPDSPLISAPLSSFLYYLP